MSYPTRPSLRRSVAALAALLALASATGCGSVNVVRKQGLTLGAVEFPLRTFAYPSGLRVIAERDVRTPLAGVFVVVGSGSSSDPAGKEGLAHYVEHLAFRTRPGGGDNFWDQLDQAGSISHNASTTFDATSYYEIGVAAALPQLLKLEGARMLSPVASIPEAERAIELDVVHNELRQRNETGFIGDVLSQLQAALFPPAHPYSRSIGGSHESLAAIRWEDVEAFAKAHYRPDNMTIVILGNVDLAALEPVLAASLPRKLVEATFPVRPPPRLTPEVPKLPESPARPAALPRSEASIASPELWIAWSLPRGFDRDGFLLSFLAGAVQRRLSRVELDDRDVVSVQVVPFPGVEASLLLCRVELQTAAHAEKTLGLLLEEAPRVPNDFVADQGQMTGARFSQTDVGFSRVRRSVLVSELLEAQDLGSRGMRRATVSHFSQDPALYSRAIRDLSEFKAERLAAFASPFLTADRARPVLFLPRTSAPPAGPAVAAAAAGPAARADAAQAPPPRAWMDALVSGAAPLTTSRLPNGLTVVLEKRPGLPLVSASLTLALGAMGLADGASANFARSFGRSTRLNDPSEYGGIVRRQAGDDHLTYGIAGASGNTEILLASLAEQARNMRVERADNVYYSEFELPWLLRREKEPSWAADRKFYAALLGDHPYGRWPQSAELEAANAGAAQQWIDRTHTPTQALLAVVGDFEPREVEKWIGESFGAWKAGAQPPPAPAPPVAAAGEVRFLATARPGATQGALHFGCLLPEAADGAVAARHRIAARLLQDRLWKALRERAGATYGASTDAVALQGGTAWLELRADIENGKLAPALAEARKALTALAATPPTAEQLGWARLRGASGLALAQMRNEAAAAQVLARARMGWSLDAAEQLRELDSVTPEQVQADFQRCLQANPTLSLVGEEAVVRAAFETGWR